MVRRVVLLTVVLVAAVAVPAGARVARHWPVLVPGPGPADISVAAVKFGVGAGRPRPALGLALHGAVSGTDYVAAAALRHPPRHGLDALVLVVGRRAPAVLTARLSRPLGAPRVSRRVRAFGSGAAGPASLCGLFSGAMSGSDVRGVMHRGAALSGFSSAAAVAQGFDQACGRTVDPLFVTAVRGPGAVSPAPVPTVPTPVPVPTGPVLPPCRPGPVTLDAVICPLQDG